MKYSSFMGTPPPSFCFVLWVVLVMSNLKILGLTKKKWKVV